MEIPLKFKIRVVILMKKEGVSTWKYLYIEIAGFNRDTAGLLETYH